MNFKHHPEPQEFRLDKSYRGALFAWPVLINRERINRNWSLSKLGYDDLGEALSDNRFMSHEGQGMTFLASAVDASFVSSARANEVSVIRMLVSLQNSLPTVHLAHEIFKINHFDLAGGGLVFIIGAVYRKAGDERPLFIPDADEFLVSKERLAMEVALSNGDLHYRHQILPAFPLSKAIAEGLRMGVQCWSSMYEEPLVCEFGLGGNGDVTFALSVGVGGSDGVEAGGKGDVHSSQAERSEKMNAVFLRFGHDVVSEKDMSSIQEAFVQCSVNSSINQTRYMH